MDKYYMQAITPCEISEEKCFGIPCLFHNEKSALVFSPKYQVTLFTYWDGESFPEDEDLWPREVFRDRRDPSVFKAASDEKDEYAECAWVPELPGRLVFNGNVFQSVTDSWKYWEERAENSPYLPDYELFKSIPVMVVNGNVIDFVAEGKTVISMRADNYEITRCVSKRFMEVWNANKDMVQGFGRYVFDHVSARMMPEDMVHGYIDFDSDGNMWFALFSPNIEWFGKDAADYGAWCTTFYSAESFLKHHPEEFEKMMATYDDYVLKNPRMHERLVRAGAYRRGEFVEE